MIEIRGVAKMKPPIVLDLDVNIEIDEWNELSDGSLHFIVRDHGPPHGVQAGAILMDRTVPPTMWEWQEEDDPQAALNFIGELVGLRDVSPREIVRKVAEELSKK